MLTCDLCLKSGHVTCALQHGATGCTTYSRFNFETLQSTLHGHTFIHVEMQLLDKVLVKIGHGLGLPSQYKLLKKIGAVSAARAAAFCQLSPRRNAPMYWAKRSFCPLYHAYNHPFDTTSVLARVSCCPSVKTAGLLSLLLL